MARPYRRSVSVQGNAAVGTFELVDTAATRALWDHAFRLALCVRLEAQTLTVRLDVENTGSAPFTFAALLHSYFAVGSIHETTVSGFRGLTYVDKMRNSDKVRRTLGCQAERGPSDAYA